MQKSDYQLSFADNEKIMLDNFEFHLILPIHYDAVIQHLRENFFSDEPLNQAVGLCEKGSTNLELEKQSLLTLADNVSIAVTHNGKVNLFYKVFETF